MGNDLPSYLPRKDVRYTPFYYSPVCSPRDGTREHLSVTAIKQDINTSCPTHNLIFCSSKLDAFLSEVAPPSSITGDWSRSRCARSPAPRCAPFRCFHSVCSRLGRGRRPSVEACAPDKRRLQFALCVREGNDGALEFSLRRMEDLAVPHPLSLLITNKSQRLLYSGRKRGGR